MCRLLQTTECVDNLCAVYADNVSLVTDYGMCCVLYRQVWLCQQCCH